MAPYTTYLALQFNCMAKLIPNYQKDLFHVNHRMSVAVISGTSASTFQTLAYRFLYCSLIFYRTVQQDIRTNVKLLSRQQHTE